MLRRARVTNLILALLLLIATGFFVYGFFQRIEAEKQRFAAEVASKEAQTQRDEAVRLQVVAEDALKVVEEQSLKIKEQFEQLRQTTDKLRLAVRDATIQRNLAIRNLNESIIQRDSARLERDNATTQYVRAEKALEKSDSLYMLSVAQSLAAKSEGIDDPQLAGLTSMQGYLYHTKYGGKKYDPYIFRGLYYSIAKLQGYNYNAAKIPGGLKNRMYALAVANQSTSFYTTGSDGRIYKGDYLNLNVDSKSIFENKGIPNRVLALSIDEKYLINASDSSYIEIINLASSAKPQRVLGHTRFVTDIKFLPDNSGFITASADKTLRFTNQESGQSKKILTLPYDLKSIDISPDGMQLAGVSYTGKLIAVDLSNYTYKEIWTDESNIKLNDSTKSVKVFNRILSVAWHPTKPLIAFGVEAINDKGRVVRGVVKLLDLRTRKIKELTGHKSGIADLDFSPDGLLLASSGLDSKLQMWVVDHEEDLPIVMDNNNGSVWDVDFTKDSRFLVASCNDGEIRIWPTDPRILAEQVCPKLERNMTTDEWDSYVGKDIGYESTCRSLLIKDFLMRRHRLFFLSLIIITLSSTALKAQNTQPAATDCEQILIQADDEFNAGRYYGIPSLLQNCLDKGNFSNEQQVRAYLLLAQAYLILDDPIAADDSYLKLLKADPEFEASMSQHPIDIYYLSKKFIATPIFTPHVRIGLNTSLPRTIYDINTSGTTLTGNDVLKVGVQAGIGVDWNIDTHWSLCIEGNYAYKAFKQDNEYFFDLDQQSIVEKQNWLDIPMYIKYADDSGKIRPFGYAGFAVNLLWSARGPDWLLKK
jgi:WD40 repeat protein